MYIYIYIYIHTHTYIHTSCPSALSLHRQRREAARFAKEDVNEVQTNEQLGEFAKCYDTLPVAMRISPFTKPPCDDLRNIKCI